MPGFSCEGTDVKVCHKLDSTFASLQQPQTWEYNLEENSPATTGHQHQHVTPMQRGVDDLPLQRSAGSSRSQAVGYHVCACGGIVMLLVRCIGRHEPSYEPRTGAPCCMPPGVNATCLKLVRPNVDVRASCSLASQAKLDFDQSALGARLSAAMRPCRSCLCFCNSTWRLRKASRLSST